jgi:hypothetical protein
MIPADKSEGGVSSIIPADKFAMVPADKSALRFDKSPTRQSRYGDGALQGIQAKTNKKTCNTLAL